ncbi:Adenosine kinase [Clonorchis sinensis]|uniref:Adenosine kinase n=1 Tax=Clonorchis sinensis TaxID=79923 RepID=A0A3R7CQM2_CLOSI|nr:Adenosine kinase [Clonorchis sinensis]
MKTITEGSILGMGNPLLDLMVKVGSDVHDRYNLKKDDAILADEHHMPLYDEISKDPNVEYAAGGATLNTMRMIQWILKDPHRCTYIGCIAADEAGDRLRKECENVKLCTRFEVTKSGASTGKCAVLVYGKYRSLVTHLGAAKELTIDHIFKRETWQSIENAYAYYLAGFAAQTCFEGVLEVAKHARSHGKLFAFNLSAPVMLHYYKEKIDAILPYVDILFGNGDEALAYAETHGLSGQSLENIVLQLASITPATSENPRKRIVSITRGQHPILVGTAGAAEVMQFPVQSIPSENIVDTNGAGDAFVAGFLAEYLHSSSIEKAISEGNKASRYIIQRSGFTLGPRDQYCSVSDNLCFCRRVFNLLSSKPT